MIYNNTLEQNRKQRIKRVVFSSVFPEKYLKYITYIFLILILSPFILIVINPKILYDKELVLPLFLTLGSAIIFYSCLVGFVLTKLKSPFLKELKEKFGYLE